MRVLDGLAAVNLQTSTTFFSDVGIELIVYQNKAIDEEIISKWPVKGL